MVFISVFKHILTPARFFWHMKFNLFSLFFCLGVVFSFKPFTNIIPITGHLISVSDTDTNPPPVPIVTPVPREPENFLPKTYEQKETVASLPNEPLPAVSSPNYSAPELLTFIENSKTGSPELTGLYIEDLLSIRITQQENNQPNWVSSSFNVVTQYDYASLTNTIGILAHNYLAGAYFYQISENQIISITDGLGQIQSFRVVEFGRYQALNPNSPETSLVDLETGEVFEAYEIYIKYYVSQPGETKLVLQTCIENNGNGSWGRYFVVAVPVQVQ
jgi:hypothetical protein